jgi:hypothetical protein
MSTKISDQVYVVCMSILKDVELNWVVNIE